MQGLRSLAAAQGVVIPAGPAGKQKTTITLTALGGIFPRARPARQDGVSAWPEHQRRGPAGIRGLPVRPLGRLLAACGDLDGLLGVEYLRGAWGLLTEPSKEP